MPDKYKSQNITSVADMLGEYLNVALKRQDQFKAPLVRTYDEEGGIKLERAHAGQVIREPEKKTNQYDRLYSVLGFAEGSDPTDVEDTYIKTQRTMIDDMRQRGAEITPEMGDTIYGNIAKTFGLDKPTAGAGRTYLRPDPTDPTQQILTKVPVGGKIPFTKEQLQTKVDRRTTAIEKNNVKIEKLQNEMAEVSTEEDVRTFKQKAKTFFSRESLIKKGVDEEVRGYAIDGGKATKKEYTEQIKINKDNALEIKYLENKNANLLESAKTFGYEEPVIEPEAIEKPVEEVLNEDEFDEFKDN